MSWTSRRSDWNACPRSARARRLSSSVKRWTKRQKQLPRHLESSLPSPLTRVSNHSHWATTSWSSPSEVSFNSPLRVLFTPSTPSYHSAYSQTFSTPGVKEHAHFLKDVKDARRIRSRILETFELAAQPTLSDVERANLLHFVIVGGGPTGIEFAAELHDLLASDM